MSLHFDDDDAGLSRFLQEATGLRKAVEGLEGIAECNNGCTICRGAAVSALSALKGEQP